MREANRSGARYAVILGDSEIKSEDIIIKNLKDGTQLKVPQSKMINKFRDLT